MSNSQHIWHRNNIYTSERKEWKYPFRANFEAEYMAWPGVGVLPAALLICMHSAFKKLSVSTWIDDMYNYKTNLFF